MKGFRSRPAVLLVNLGTPEQATIPAVRAFLREFLGDPRVVEIPRPIWWIILNCFVLPLRPTRVVEAYQAIWTEEGSPMRVITMRQKRKLQQRFDASTKDENIGSTVRVEYAMTYGEPEVEYMLDKLYREGHRRIVVLPLYPQYSGSTTGAVFDQVANYLKAERALPGVTLINSYFYQSAYIEALARSIREFWSAHGNSDYLLFSYHGVPQSYIDNGDPYSGHCECTTAAVVENLQLQEDRYSMAYQSRFGRATWLQPYTDQKIIALAQSGIKKLDVVCPAFASDCLETLEEIAMQGRDLFLEHGGEELRLIPCLNDSEHHIEALQAILQPYLDAIV